MDGRTLMWIIRKDLKNAPPNITAAFKKEGKTDSLKQNWKKVNVVW